MFAFFCFAIFFSKEKRKNEKKRKEKAFRQVGLAELSRFLMEILPEGWRFSSKPEGLDLENPFGRVTEANPPIFAELFY